jgi:hypothetical protein
VLVSGCGGGSNATPGVEDAKPFADGFVHRLVEVGTWDAVEADISPQLTPQLRDFQAHIQRDGVRRVTSGGVLRHDCPTSPVVSAEKDCFVYVVSGRQVVPVAGVQKIKARLRLWPAYEDGHWQVINYDYDVLTR